jgi:hypothetical protein
MKINRLSLKYNLKSVAYGSSEVEVTNAGQFYKQKGTGRMILKSTVGNVYYTSNNLESISLYAYCEIADSENVKIKLNAKFEEMYAFRESKFNRLKEAYNSFNKKTVHMTGNVNWINPANNTIEPHPHAPVIETCIEDFNNNPNEKNDIQIGETLTQRDSNGTDISWRVVGINKIRLDSGANLKDYLVENV